MAMWNLALRFVLEMASLVAMVIWGLGKGDGLGRYVLGIGVPLLAAVLWGAFAAEGDPSRSGQTVIPTPGMMRLGLELAFFALASWTLHDAGSTPLALTLGAATVLHYLVSYRRVVWLLGE